MINLTYLTLSSFEMKVSLVDDIEMEWPGG